MKLSTSLLPWQALNRHVDDGLIEIDNNPVERESDQWRSDASTTSLKVPTYQACNYSLAALKCFYCYCQSVGDQQALDYIKY